jgi:hypothetical protein
VAQRSISRPRIPIIPRAVGCQFSRAEQSSTFHDINFIEDEYQMAQLFSNKKAPDASTGVHLFCINKSPTGIVKKA